MISLRLTRLRGSPARTVLSPESPLALHRVQRQQGIGDGVGDHPEDATERD